MTAPWIATSPSCSEGLRHAERRGLVVEEVVELGAPSLDVLGRVTGPLEIGPCDEVADRRAVRAPLASRGGEPGAEARAIHFRIRPACLARRAGPPGGARRCPRACGPDRGRSSPPRIDRGRAPWNHARRPEVLGHLAGELRRVREELQAEARAALEGVLLQDAQAEGVDRRDRREVELGERPLEAPPADGPVGGRADDGAEIVVASARRILEGVERLAQAAADAPA